MKNLSLFMLVAAIFVSCSTPETTPVDQLNARRDSLSAVIEDLKAQLADVDLQLASFDSTRSFASVTTFDIAQGAFDHAFQVYGTVMSDKSVTLYPEMAGSIARVTVKGGERVRAGQVLVSLDGSMAQANLAEVKTQLELAKSVFEKQERLWNQKIGSEVQYLQAKTQFEALQKRLSAVQKQVSMTTISAPFDGVVDQVFAKEGEYGAPGMPMVRLVGNGGLRLEMQVPETYIQRIEKGDGVVMNFSAIQLTLEGSVGQVGNYINPGSRTFGVTVELPKNQNLKANMMASVALKDYSTESAITIPNRLILQDTKGMNYTYVYVQEGELGRIARRDLVLGVSNDEFTEVKSGVVPGDKVVDRGIRSVQPDQIVKLY